MHSLEHFAADTRSFKVRTLFSKKLQPVPKRNTTLEPIWAIDSLIRSKSFAYPISSKIS